MTELRYTVSLHFKMKKKKHFKEHLKMVHVCIPQCISQRKTFVVLLMFPYIHVIFMLNKMNIKILSIFPDANGKQSSNFFNWPCLSEYRLHVDILQNHFRPSKVWPYVRHMANLVLRKEQSLTQYVYVVFIFRSSGSLGMV